MSATAFEDRRRVVVACGFDEHTRYLVEAGEQICLRTGKTLDLVHVSEPWLDQAMIDPLGQGIAIADLGRSVDETVRRQGERMVNEVAAKIHSGVHVETHVCTGPTAECLAEHAAKHDACLVVVGIGSASESASRFLPEVFSTALSLMHDSAMPVLVLPSNMVGEFKTERLRMLMLDDLSEHTEPAVEFAFDFATALGPTQLRHLYVGGEAEATTDEAYKSVLGQLRQRLASRALGREEYLENTGGTYEIDIRSGKVAERIEEVVSSFDPDVCVFGKHKALHRSPFYLGRVPSRAMLSLGKPVVVVPSPPAAK